METGPVSSNRWSENFAFWSLLKTFFINSFLSKCFLTIDHFSAYYDMTPRYEARRCVRQRRTFATSARTPVVVATKALGPAYLGAVLLHAESQTSAWHCSTLEVWAFHAEFLAGGLLFIWSRQNQWGQGQRVDSISLRFGQGRRQRRVGRVPGMAWVMNSGRNSFSPCEPCCPGVKARAFCL